jgi:putative heme-binding domain-containing protein
MRRLQRLSEWLRTRGRTVGIAVLAALALPALAQHGSSTAVNPYTSREDEQAGAKLFRAQCAGCHGPDGTGTGAGPNLASGTLAHGHSDEAVFTSISKGFPGTSMPAFSFSGLQVWQLVTHLRALEIARGASQVKGDPQAGAAVFRANCSGCHAANGEGGLSAPDLTAVGRRRSAPEIRESITNPDAVVPSEYWSVAATTTTGGTVRGIRLNEDTFSLQVRDEKGRLVSLLKRDLKNIEVIRRSPMPSFESKLTGTQIDDVIAWLINLGGQQ